MTIAVDPWIEAEYEVAVGAAAMLRSRKFGNEQVRAWLSGVRSLDELLDRAETTKAAINGSLSSIKSAMDAAEAFGIDAVPFGSPRYPSWLKLIHNAPPVLYVRGNLHALTNKPGISVVGTRNATSDGTTIAKRLAAHIGNEGWAVVSGLAVGIDTAAHMGVLETQSPGVAVLAHGLDIIYPKGNKQLSEQLLAAGGVLVSEHPPGTAAEPNQFSTRNRIQVGLSAASVIVEGDVKSGTMVHAEYAIQANRPLFAVMPDGRKVATRAALPRKLIAEHHAMAIRDRNDYAALIGAANDWR